MNYYLSYVPFYRMIFALVTDVETSKKRTYFFCLYVLDAISSYEKLNMTNLHKIQQIFHSHVTKVHSLMSVAMQKNSFFTFKCKVTSQGHCPAYDCSPSVILRRLAIFLTPHSDAALSAMQSDSKTRIFNLDIEEISEI